MNNIAESLIDNSEYKITFMTNTFDNNEIIYTGHDGTELRFKDRNDFIEFIERNKLTFDIVHAHSWHLSDYYKPFHTLRDQLELQKFMKKLRKPRFIFTDHSNPTEDLRRLNEHYPSFDYSSLTEDEKSSFLYKHLLDYVPQWEKGWEATSLLSKRQIMDFADVIAFVSKTQMEEEEENIPHYTFHNKARVIMNGVDIGKYNTPHIKGIAKSLRQELNIDSNEKVVLFAGRMDQEKGIYDLAQAAESMNKRGENVTLIYLGSNGVSADVKSKIQNYSPHVKTLFPAKIERNQREKMAAMYAMADIVAQPTWGECFNQTVAESLAMGTPAVVSNFSAPGEIYVKSGAALGVKVRDPVDLATKISQLLNNKETYDLIKKQGQKLVETSLTVESMGQNYLRLYEMVTQIKN